jgi:hypothetical protein
MLMFLPWLQRTTRRTTRGSSGTSHAAACVDTVLAARPLSLTPAGVRIRQWPARWPVWLPRPGGRRIASRASPRDHGLLGGQLSGGVWLAHPPPAAVPRWPRRKASTWPPTRTRRWSGSAPGHPGRPAPPAGAAAPGRAPDRSVARSRGRHSGSVRLRRPGPGSSAPPRPRTRRCPGRPAAGPSRCTGPSPAPRGAAPGRPRRGPAAPPAPAFRVTDWMAGRRPWPAGGHRRGCRRGRAAARPPPQPVPDSTSPAGQLP